ncbi:hypothetical protein PHLH5_10050 [Pseudomonas sp. Cab53]|uniref:Uncharacterized protein n=2 Tax=Pseudomonas TaxID=286 RepID=A0A423GGH2_9PSED|nr:MULTISPECIES: hypothetical protein [Pseudomonas]KIQ59007.1 hypothetical protein RL74_12895 [Pseudomonas fluorescens]ROM86915.1 hypothetical protein BK652_01725 [Pseudomonas brassicacearum]BBP63464.1 hypothetical protein PHLH5_10050 [Pseudomonas sp. Cab53]
MNPLRRSPVQRRLIQIVGPSLLFLLIGTYASSASAASYLCKYHSMPGFVFVKNLFVSASSTQDALTLARATFKQESFYADYNWITCEIPVSP